MYVPEITLLKAWYPPSCIFADVVVYHPVGPIFALIYIWYKCLQCDALDLSLRARHSITPILERDELPWNLPVQVSSLTIYLFFICGAE